MKLEKKHYYWIGGIIIALVLIYVYRKNISSAFTSATSGNAPAASGSTTRQFVAGRTVPTCGTRLQNINMILQALGGEQEINRNRLNKLTDAELCAIITDTRSSSATGKSKACCSVFSGCWNNPAECCKGWDDFWSCHGGLA